MTTDSDYSLLQLGLIAAVSLGLVVLGIVATDPGPEPAPEVICKEVSK